MGNFVVSEITEYTARLTGRRCQYPCDIVTLLSFHKHSNKGCEDLLCFISAVLFDITCGSKVDPKRPGLGDIHYSGCEAPILKMGSVCFVLFVCLFVWLVLVLFLGSTSGLYAD